MAIVPEEEEYEYFLVSKLKGEEEEMLLRSTELYFAKQLVQNLDKINVSLVGEVQARFNGGLLVWTRDERNVWSWS